MGESGISKARVGPIDKMVNLGDFSEVSRLTIEIDPEAHRQIKTLATFAGMTIKDYILSKAIPPRSGSVDGKSPSPNPAKNVDRLRSAIAAPWSEHVAFDSLEDLKNALGI